MAIAGGTGHRAEKLHIDVLLEKHAQEELARIDAATGGPEGRRRMLEEASRVRRAIEMERRWAEVVPPSGVKVLERVDAANPGPPHKVDPTSWKELKRLAFRILSIPRKEFWSGWGSRDLEAAARAWLENPRYHDNRKEAARRAKKKLSAGGGRRERKKTLRAEYAAKFLFSGAVSTKGELAEKLEISRQSLYNSKSLMAVWHEWETRGAQSKELKRLVMKTEAGTRRAR